MTPGPHKTPANCRCTNDKDSARRRALGLWLRICCRFGDDPEVVRRVPAPEPPASASRAGCVGGGSRASGAVVRRSASFAAGRQSPRGGQLLDSPAPSSPGASAIGINSSASGEGWARTGCDHPEVHPVARPISRWATKAKRGTRNLASVGLVGSVMTTAPVGRFERQDRSRRRSADSETLAQHAGCCALLGFHPAHEVLAAERCPGRGHPARARRGRTAPLCVLGA
jgi:hypothetical protein